ncbi:MAG TPA: alpha/beta fold hydrolase [Gemmatimonadaceae bacterium]|jgi:dipeptidyl aminopeptidase/acylaminoacyl peptidase|nr:alpha/beta fold hydrolase [Gemmatimonadaceae bacterium]
MFSSTSRSVRGHARRRDGARSNPGRFDLVRRGLGRRDVALALAALAIPLAACATGQSASSQQPTAQRPAARADTLQPQERQQQRRQRQQVVMDSARARELYVSKDPADMPTCRCERDMEEKRATDSTFAARSEGVIEFRKVTYKSRIDGLEIPAYLFAPLQKRGPKGHAAMVWVHGGVHGDMTADYFPFIREAVERGYVIITPDYRGSTGHGEALYKAIDYGGKEIDDVISAVDYLATLPYVDTTRLGIMGWSHGGFITAHVLFRGDDQPFKSGAAIVPVTNLVFRLSYKGPGYQRYYATEPGIGGLPFEAREEYIKRSPVFHAANLTVPILVHVATNDTDVDFVEDQQMVYTLRALKPDLAETKIYVDPAPGPHGEGHSFSRRVNPVTLEREDSPAQIDSWNRTWAFFERTLHPEQGAASTTDGRK